ncbi:MAG TPA: hypothetical protein VGP62_29535 [Bryobacteraceae bacterium]|jgi:hypothetical protein|nr:hypothetical protein [Bryobacteraceae bacterium]
MPAARSPDFRRILANLFRKGGWRILRPAAAGLVIEAGRHKYVVEVKAASEGRRDRLIPLLSQAILEAQASARRFPSTAAPLAVVASRRVPESVAEHLQRFAEQNAPGVAIGVIDSGGFRSFAGAGLEALNAPPPRHPPTYIISPQRLPNLFSDLNQWMLKILLGQRLPKQLIDVPRQRIQNASQLAEAAQVSGMSASRFVNQLAERGFLDKDEAGLKIVRLEELLDLWAADQRTAANELPARWIIKGGPDQLFTALREYASGKIHNQPKCCLGLFAAADALGLGFVRGALPHIYLAHLPLESTIRLGLDIGKSNRPADVMLRIPANPKAVFGPLVKPDGIPVSDVLQVWLDVSTHPGRGREQAREIRRRALGALFQKRQ